MKFKEGLPTYRDLVTFQLHVADHWIFAAGELTKLGVSAVEFQFVAYFSAFNALYWLWGIVTSETAFTDVERALVDDALAQLQEPLRKRVTDRLRGPVGDEKLIGYLVASLDTRACAAILENDEVAKGVAHLLERAPIQRMNRRAEDGVTGSVDEGRCHQRRLREELDASDRIHALCQMLYLVRCNLVHGSKVASGVDAELLQYCIDPLRLITEASLKMIQEAAS